MKIARNISLGIVISCSVISCKKEDPDPNDNGNNNTDGHLLDNHLGTYSGTTYMVHNWCYGGTDSGSVTQNQASVVDVTLYGDSLINVTSVSGPSINQNYLVGQGTSSSYVDTTACGNCEDVYSINFVTIVDSVYVYRSSESGTCAGTYDFNDWHWKLLRDF